MEIIQRLTPVIRNSITIRECCRKNLNKSRYKQVARTYIGQTYDASGKTTGIIVNKKGTETICINGIHCNGFKLNNGWNVFGSAIFFPHTALSWNVKTIHDLTEESLSLFAVMRPKVEVLFLGYGSRSDISHEKIKDFVITCKKMNLNFEVTTTDNACASFNFCSLDKRFVAAALIPPSKITFHHGFTDDKGVFALIAPEEEKD